MKKDYLKPDVEYIKLVAQEAIAADDDDIEGDNDLSSDWDEL